MDTESLLRQALLEPTEELLTPERLREMAENGFRLKHYIGFEVSGLVHLGTGIVSMQKLVDLQRAGVETTVFLADYHSWINKKLGGDLSTIRRVAGGYFKEALKVSIKIVGGDPERVSFLMGSDVYEKLGLEYFTNVVKVSMDTTLSRVKRSITILGRKEAESLSFAQLLYVPMQVADIFSMGVTIAQGGMDQRKAHVIAIEVGEKAFGYKPVALHHHLLPGLAIDKDSWTRLVDAKRRGDKGEFSDILADVKMSKSKPETAIFIHDQEDKIKEKIMGAFCPAGEVELNPVLEITRYIIFRNRSEPLEVLNKKTGERLVFSNYQELEQSFRQKKLHPLDLKNVVAEELARILEPARKHFLEGPGRSYLEDLEGLKITR
ncbi:MAG: tyrosine--tRNA ligase [Infirmifilum sp.]